MFKPCGDLIFIEVMKRYEGIFMPDNVKPGQGDIFKVLAVGPGLKNEQGEYVPCDVKAGDIVYLAGKILELPTDDDKIMVARASDVLAYERAEA